MSYMFVMGACFRCNKIITFNPNKVPSVKDENAVKQPICASCVKEIQDIQKEMGVEVWPDPLAEAYDAEEVDY